jgi:hypothetical protein
VGQVRFLLTEAAANGCAANNNNRTEDGEKTGLRRGTAVGLLKSVTESAHAVAPPNGLRNQTEHALYRYCWEVPTATER